MFAALCVLLAATGHLLMSGTAVPWWAFCLGFTGAATTAWSLADRERGILAVTGAAVAVQAVLHSGFSLAQSLAQPLPQTLPRSSAPSVGLAAAPATTVPAGAALHAHHAGHGTADALSAPAAVHMAGGGHQASAVPMVLMSPAGMLLAHLLAAVLCGLWLAHGERALFRVVRAVAARLRTPLCLLLRPAAVAHRPRPRVRRARRTRAPRQLFLVHAITSRGPPTATAVL
ncbi:hypothetical protein AW27_004000 [Streptomyces sp. PCS3-D2]|uniref:hypothetical protein n=1 Tax=Streptomyces sp. PCS3-D2 TaxID=1460244 RepID=UPI000445A024|nr:hypothetical protein [Streptomyces sp. PCS3-D2]WKV70755.1 hypothetical protein AW27_004000 [Streptomyces sp. PCS3-D2]